ncbi:MAG: SDR family oxidoreductase [Spirochaetia bacterium]|nr:SDR family oxidoreductase [Spirochaetia bacterium]
MSKVIVITGASKGLGKALALHFAAQKQHLALCARGEKELASVAKDAAALGAEVLTCVADASIPKDVERFIALVESRYERIDVLINNASILGPSPMPFLTDYPEADFEQVLRVNCLGPFLVTRRVLPGMLGRNSGSVINVSSEAGNTGYPGWGAYSVSKFALEGLSEVWSAELAETKVRLNWVDPGEMNTDMHRLAVPDCNYELAEPKNVVGVFDFLASEASASVNGKRFLAQDFQLEKALA